MSGSSKSSRDAPEANPPCFPRSCSSYRQAQRHRTSFRSRDRNYYGTRVGRSRHSATIVLSLDGTFYPETPDRILLVRVFIYDSE